MGPVLLPQHVETMLSTYMQIQVYNSNPLESDLYWHLSNFFQGRFFFKVLKAHAVLQGHKLVPWSAESPQRSWKVSDAIRGCWRSRKMQICCFLSGKAVRTSCLNQSLVFLSSFIPLPHVTAGIKRTSWKWARLVVTADLIEKHWPQKGHTKVLFSPGNDIFSK